ncbi:OLC1v1027380C2 [Oldenlandia corymbosa var. corymbosa]|nr:OLC1v1027380C2 [Oldenlandia corymbosa var. corymbosa]
MRRKHASKPKKREPNSGQESSSWVTESEEQMIADNKAEKQGNGNQTLTTDSCGMSPDSIREAGKLEQGSPAAEAEVSLENGASKSEKKKRNRSKGLDLPRRTSKRLAGVEVDISLEPTVRTRKRRAAGRETSQAEESGSKTCENVAKFDGHDKKLSAKNEADLKPERVDVLPPGDSNVLAENPNLGVTECMADHKEEVPLDLSELMKYPCIEFAVKTLIGEETKPTVNAGGSANISNVVADTCQDLPSMQVWADPCFEFAVKTLIGDAPLETEPALEAMLQKPSGNSVEQNASAVPSLQACGVGQESSDLIRQNVADTPEAKRQL